MNQQGGIPLTKEMLRRMSDEERTFLVGFLKQVKMIVKKFEKDGVISPYTPSDNLQEKFELVIKYGGGKYCQIRKIEKLFQFEK